MKNTRRHLALILICLVTSVFLFCCGEPTFCDLLGVSITADEQAGTFSVVGTDDDVLKIEKGPGLILFYLISEESTLPQKIKSSLSSEFDKATLYRLSIKDGGNVCTITDGDTVYKLCVFSEGNSFPASPLYNYDLSPFINGNSFEGADFSVAVVDDVTYSLNSVDLKLQTEELPPDNHVHIFAAFSAEVGQFSNNYWSDLYYITSF